MQNQSYLHRFDVRELQMFLKGAGRGYDGEVWAIGIG